MIIGTGIDIVEIDRIRRVLLKIETKFIERILSPMEIELMNKRCNNSEQIIHFLAKRFVAKEAISKAIGTGIGKFLTWHDVIVLTNPMGKPYVEKNRKLGDIIRKFCHISQFDLYLSISDDKKYAIANAILESGSKKIDIASGLG